MQNGNASLGPVSDLFLIRAIRVIRGSENGTLASALSTNFFEGFRDCVLQRARAGSVQGEIDLFKAPDQIEDFAACEGSTGSGAKMGTAAEWSIVVDQTIAGDRFEHRARTARIFRQRFAASGAQPSRGNDRFPLR